MAPAHVCCGDDSPVNHHVEDPPNASGAASEPLQRRPTGRQGAPVLEHIEPKSDGLANWLDLEVPGDRSVASALL